MKIVDFQQNSSEWYDWRLAGIGSSDSSIIMGVSPYKDRDSLLQEKAEKLRRMTNTKSQQWGKDQEPYVRETYTKLTGIKTRPVCVVHDEYPWLRASLDGLSEDNQIILEIKCTNWMNHQEALRNQIPELYIPQVQHQLLVTGLKTLHYVSYNRSNKFSPSDQLTLVEVTPDVEYQQQLFEQEKRDWEYLQSQL